MTRVGANHPRSALIRRAAVPFSALLLAIAISQGLGDAPTPGPSDAPTRGPSDAPTGRPGASPAAPVAGDYILLPRAELMSRPTSGPAWTSVVETAEAPWPRPDFNDQDNQTDTLALAAALVFARTGDAAMRTKARDALMAVIPTFDRGRLGPGLAPLRQTAGWVLAADLIELEGRDDEAFRAFLERVLTDPTGTHTRWNHVVAAHDDAANNWGAWAGAARIAASLYLGRDLADAARTVRGFLGDRGAWAEFYGQKEPLSQEIGSWACEPSRRGFLPVNGPCTKGGVDLDGAVPADVSRGSDGPPSPPSSTGIMYTHETLAGYLLQAELLYRNGYPDIYEFRSQALRRMADFISRSEAAGGPGWNPGRVQYHVPWVLNRRYGTSYPTVPAEYGRSFGYTDWLYGP